MCVTITSQCSYAQDDSSTPATTGQPQTESSIESDHSNHPFLKKRASTSGRQSDDSYTGRLGTLAARAISQAPGLIKRAYSISWNPAKVTLTYQDGSSTDAVEKGKGLLCKLAAGAGPASLWTNKADLDTWGWSYQVDSDVTVAEESPDLEPALNGLGISTAAYPRNQMWYAGQEESTPAIRVGTS